MPISVLSPPTGFTEAVHGEAPLRSRERTATYPRSVRRSEGITSSSRSVQGRARETAQTDRGQVAAGKTRLLGARSHNLGRKHCAFRSHGALLDTEPQFREVLPWSHLEKQVLSFCLLTRLGGHRLLYGCKNKNVSVQPSGVQGKVL